MVTSKKSGFVFKIPKPGSLEQTGEKRYYLGFYNTKTTDPWKGGYILRISQGGDKNSLRWEAFANASGMQFIASGEIRDIVENEIIVYAWLEGTDSKTNNSLFNVIIGNTRILKDATLSDVKVGVGSYMSFFNVIADKMHCSSVTKIVTLREKYMNRFGNVTSPDYVDSSLWENLETNNDKNDVSEPTKDKAVSAPVIIFIVSGIGVLLIVGGAIIRVIYTKKKSKKTQSE